MKQFLKNPLEAILNYFGYTIQPRRSLLLMSMMDFTHESHLQQLNRQGRIHEILVKR